MAGLTLIEVIVAVAILALFVSAIVGGFSSYADRQLFRQYVEDVRFSIKEQRQRTLASVDDTQYGVYVGTSSVEYFEGSAYSMGASSNTVQFLPNDITATSSFSSGNWYVSFNRLTGNASATGTITLFDGKTQQFATITITTLGLIE